LKRPLAPLIVYVASLPRPAGHHRSRETFWVRRCGERARAASPGGRRRGRPLPIAL